MFFPLRTDTSFEHRPYATFGLIAACFALSIAMWTDAIDAESLMLQYDVIRPHQWITSNFLHADVIHLLGNSIFLWVFGMIVEGRVGPARFLAIAAAIGIPQCALEQLLFSNGASLGASSVVYGLMGVSLVWAPLVEVTFFWFLFIRAGTFEVTVRATAIGYALWESFWLAMTFLTHGFAVTSELLHLMGFAIGVPVGVWMLRKRLVNCGGWDWFSVRAGRHRQGVPGGSPPETRAQAPNARRTPPQPRLDPLAELRRAIANGDADRAYAAGIRVRDPLERTDLIGLADLLYSARLWPEAAERLSEIRRRFSDAPMRVSLRRAEIAIRHEMRPSAALGLLKTLPESQLNYAQTQLHAELVAEAERAAANNPLELAGDL